MVMCIYQFYSLGCDFSLSDYFGWREGVGGFGYCFLYMQLVFGDFIVNKVRICNFFFYQNENDLKLYSVIIY